MFRWNQTRLGLSLFLVPVFMVLSVQSAKALDDVGDFDMGEGGHAPNRHSEDVRGVQMGLPVYGGTGCPSGSVASVLSPDNKTLSLLFDQYIVETNGQRGEGWVAKKCVMDIPFKVPVGYQVTVVKLDYRGYNYLPSKALAKYRVAYRFIDESGRPYGRRYRRQRLFHGPVDSDYIMNSVVRNHDLWSECGRDFNLHIETLVEAKASPHGEGTFSTVDSIDAGGIDNDIDYHLLWRRCQGRGGEVERRHRYRDRNEEWRDDLEAERRARREEARNNRRREERAREEERRDRGRGRPVVPGSRRGR